jgi:hypothetical protein
MFLAFKALSSDKKATIWAKMGLKGETYLSMSFPIYDWLIGRGMP